MNKTGGQVNLNSDLTMATGYNLTLTAATMNLNGHTVTVDCPSCGPSQAP